MKEEEIFIKKIKKRIQDSNINFLLGAGLSVPYLPTLGGIEIQLSEPSISNQEKIHIKKKYFDDVMSKNLEIISSIRSSSLESTLKHYMDFYKIWNNIMLHRKNTILSKQINVFTTNIDVFNEVALEETSLEFNDGFSGKFKHIYNIGNFKKSLFRRSLHYENTSEIPLFNLMKIHGSLTWKKNSTKNEIEFDNGLSLVANIKNKSTLIKSTSTASGTETTEEIEFQTEYEKLMIVPPSKDKFSDTLLNQYYYDLLRIYSNELEKENTVLFVMGFSFADEHIRDMTLRVANTNPTLHIYIFCHSGTIDSGIKMLRDSSKNKNIDLIVPKDEKKFTLETMNSEVYEKIVQLQSIENLDIYKSTLVNNLESKNEE